MGSLTAEVIENIFLFAFIPPFVSFAVCTYVQYFFVAARKLQFIICNNQTADRKRLL